MSTTHLLPQFQKTLCLQPQLSPQEAFVVPLSILIVDDSADIRLLMRMGLEGYGYQCDEAQNGLEALRKLQHICFHVVLTDYQMPFLNGMELAQHIRDTAFPSPPLVIMMTGSDTRLLRPVGLALGIQEILSKPCSPADVDRVVRQFQAKFPWAA